MGDLQDTPICGNGSGLNEPVKQEEVKVGLVGEAVGDQEVVVQLGRSQSEEVLKHEALPAAVVVQPADVKPAGIQPVDVKTLNVKSVDTKPVDQVLPVCEDKAKPVPPVMKAGLEGNPGPVGGAALKVDDRNPVVVDMKPAPAVVGNGAANVGKPSGGKPRNGPTPRPSIGSTPQVVSSKDVKTSSFKSPDMGSNGMKHGPRGNSVVAARVQQHNVTVDSDPGRKRYSSTSDISDDIPDWLRKYETVLGHVNQYVLFDQIGKGMQGSVYKCLNMDDKQIYAIKALENASLRRRRKVGSNVNSLKNEIAIMKMLDHPNLVKLYEVIDDAQHDRLYLVMDYVEGGNVMGDNDVLKSEKPLELAIPEEKARKLFADFVLGMEYLHYHGVLHRDIKPSNMLIDNNTEDGIPRLKVCDFGVSSLCSNDKSAKVLGEDDLVYVGFFGTVAMMSPEALGAGPDNIYHGRPADVWAAGVTLYCMLTGTLPFKGNSIDVIREQICGEEPVSFPSKPKLSKNAKKLILKMLAKDPAQRVTMSLIREDPWMVDEGVAVNATKDNSFSSASSLQAGAAEGGDTIVGELSASEKCELKPAEQDVQESVNGGFFESWRSRRSRNRKSSRSPRESFAKLGNTFQAIFTGERRGSKRGSGLSKKDTPDSIGNTLSHGSDSASSLPNMGARQNSDDVEIAIGAPSNFVHQEHVGLREDGTFKHFGVHIENFETALHNETVETTATPTD